MTEEDNHQGHMEMVTWNAGPQKLTISEEVEIFKNCGRSAQLLILENGGWRLLNEWTRSAIASKDVAVIKSLLATLLTMPTPITQLVANANGVVWTLEEFLWRLRNHGVQAGFGLEDTENMMKEAAEVFARWLQLRKLYETGDLPEEEADPRRIPFETENGVTGSIALDMGRPGLAFLALGGRIRMIRVRARQRPLSLQKVPPPPEVPPPLLAILPPPPVPPSPSPEKDDKTVFVKQEVDLDAVLTNGRHKNSEETLRLTRCNSDEEPMEIDIITISDDEEETPVSTVSATNGKITAEEEVTIDKPRNAHKPKVFVTPRSRSDHLLEAMLNTSSSSAPPCSVTIDAPSKKLGKPVVVIEKRKREEVTRNEVEIRMEVDVAKEMERKKELEAAKEVELKKAADVAMEVEWRKEAEVVKEEERKKEVERRKEAEAAKEVDRRKAAEVAKDVERRKKLPEDKEAPASRTPTSCLKPPRKQPQLKRLSSSVPKDPRTIRSKLGESEAAAILANIGKDLGKPKKIVTWFGTDGRKETWHFETDDDYPKCGLVKEKWISIQFNSEDEEEDSDKDSGDSDKLVIDEDPRSDMEVVEEIPWRLRKIYPAPPMTTLGVDSYEKEFQATRERFVVQSNLCSGTVVPDCPEEVDEDDDDEDFQEEIKEPVIIPTQDVIKGSILRCRDTEIFDHSKKSWPEPARDGNSVI